MPEPITPIAPIVRIEIEHARESLKRMLSQRASDYQEICQRVVHEAFEEFDFDAEIKAVVGPLLKRGIEATVKSAIAEVLLDREVHEKLVNVVKESVVKVAAELVDVHGSEKPL